MTGTFLAGNTVGFYARLEKPIPHLGDGQPIKFDKVITNIGQAYDSHNGRFTVPVSGMYLLSVSVMSTDTNTIDCKIIKNGNILAYVYGGSTDYQTDTQTIVVDLQAGDIIWVRHSPGYSDEQINVNYSYMSGFLIKQHAW